MADWSELQAAASEHGGLIEWHAEIPEGQDILLELEQTVMDSAGLPYDWTACTAPAAAIYTTPNEIVVVALTWIPRADGSFAFTASKEAMAGTAGNRSASTHGRSLSWAASVTLPTGVQIQLVAESPVTIRHKGV